jgi:hypothetical protein
VADVHSLKKKHILSGFGGFWHDSKSVSGPPFCLEAVFVVVVGRTATASYMAIF